MWQIPGGFVPRDEKYEEEDIKSFWFSEDEIENMIKNDKILYCHALIAWCLYKLKKL